MGKKWKERVQKNSYCFNFIPHQVTPQTAHPLFPLFLRRVLEFYMSLQKEGLNFLLALPFSFWLLEIRYQTERGGSSRGHLNSAIILPSSLPSPPHFKIEFLSLPASFRFKIDADNINNTVVVVVVVVQYKAKVTMASKKRVKSSRGVCMCALNLERLMFTLEEGGRERICSR